jgi:O-antigen ligase
MTFKYLRTKLKNIQLIDIELLLISLMLLTLPSVEAPKNIFLIFFVSISLWRQYLFQHLKIWRTWDWMFVFIILTAFLSTIFAGLSPGDEWKGFRVLLTFISVGWLVARSGYSSKQIAWLFWLSIMSAIPPLLWGLYELWGLHSKDTLELHSVGHVNHSAIYLTVLFGAILGATLSFWQRASSLNKLYLSGLSFLFFASLIIGQSRAALGIGTIIGVIFLSLLSKTKKIKWAGLASLLFILSGAILLNTPIFQKQISYQKDKNILAGRAVIWHTTIEAGKLYPVFGIGIDNRALVTRDIIQASLESQHKAFDESLYDFHYKHSHSFYLTQLAERGIVGSMATLGFILLWLQTLFSSFYLNKLNQEASYLWAGSASAWMATFGIGFVNTTFHHEHGILACLFLGLHLAFLNRNQSKNK